MKTSESKPGAKLSGILGFLVIMLGVVFLTTGTVLNKHHENKGFSLIMWFGIFALVVGLGLQVREIVRRKKP